MTERTHTLLEAFIAVVQCPGVVVRQKVGGRRGGGRERREGEDRYFSGNTVLTQPIYLNVGVLSICLNDKVYQ